MPEQPPRTSELHVDLGVLLRPEDYLRFMIAVWTVLMAGGNERHAVITHDDTVTDEQVSEMLERLIQTCPWGW